ncbi:hypothetical protein FNJ88_08085 [Chryseobacterium sp. SNU WT5]|uniref:hypothetical protein n=1 Tax=Chryseobacterium sp. SNU WT5 TaxID=2594269 RepID=UPI00117EF737|nr:hypothetical protein [Chryseobacterium sp. SNU WT5]QDP85520.1 hypothetical protein FNJ88_08085 [Chryseobacterium sp. SNU WT5]
MKLFYHILSSFVLILIISCNSENRDNSRAYVEGKITGTQAVLSKATVSIKSDGKNVAEVIPNASGNFTLSGPLLNDSFTLVLNTKIKSFSTTKLGCTLSTDSLQIQIPVGTTYITFNEIKLE